MDVSFLICRAFFPGKEYAVRHVLHSRKATQIATCVFSNWKHFQAFEFIFLVTKGKVKEFFFRQLADRAPQ